jgi:hypothetical protein
MKLWVYDNGHRQLRFSADTQEHADSAAEKVCPGISDHLRSSATCEATLHYDSSCWIEWAGGPMDGMKTRKQCLSAWPTAIYVAMDVPPLSEESNIAKWSFGSTRESLHRYDFEYVTEEIPRYEWCGPPENLDSVE